MRNNLNVLPTIVATVDIYILVVLNRIGGVMISVLASSAVDRGFEPRSGQTKDLVFVASPLSTHH